MSIHVVLDDVYTYSYEVRVMSTKKVVKKAVKGSATMAVKKVKPETKKPDMPSVSTGKNLPGIMPEVTDKIALKREKFIAAQRNNGTLVVRINSDILNFLSEEGWKAGGGAATIARQVLESWYLRACEKANAKTDKK